MSDSYATNPRAPRRRNPTARSRLQLPSSSEEDSHPKANTVKLSPQKKKRKARRPSPPSEQFSDEEQKRTSINHGGRRYTTDHRYPTRGSNKPTSQERPGLGPRRSTRGCTSVNYNEQTWTAEAAKARTDAAHEATKSDSSAASLSSEEFPLATQNSLTSSPGPSAVSNQLARDANRDRLDAATLKKWDIPLRSKKFRKEKVRPRLDPKGKREWEEFEKNCPQSVGHAIFFPRARLGHERVFAFM